MDLNLRHVRAFVSVAHLRSFTRALLDRNP
jgi:DNA-binding transcriptional LysR family regulator